MANQRRMTMQEQREYDQLTKKAEQLEFSLDDLLYQPVRYGYVFVSSKQNRNSLDEQERAVREAGAEYVFVDEYTGPNTKRTELEKLLHKVNAGDTIVISKLDRIANSVQHGITFINDLVQQGVRVHVMNIGVMDHSSTGRLILNTMLRFAEFECEMNMQKAREGKVAARSKEGYREVRKPKYSECQLKLALELLQSHSYAQVVEITGISKRTLIRAKHRFQNDDLDS